MRGSALSLALIAVAGVTLLAARPSASDSDARNTCDFPRSTTPREIKSWMVEWHDESPLVKLVDDFDDNAVPEADPATYFVEPCFADGDEHDGSLFLQRFPPRANPDQLGTQAAGFQFRAPGEMTVTATWDATLPLCPSSGNQGEYAVQVRPDPGRNTGQVFWDNVRVGVLRICHDAPVADELRAFLWVTLENNPPTEPVFQVARLDLPLLDQPMLQMELSLERVAAGELGEGEPEALIPKGRICLGDDQCVWEEIPRLPLLAAGVEKMDPGHAYYGAFLANPEPDSSLLAAAAIATLALLRHGRTSLQNS